MDCLWRATGNSDVVAQFEVFKVGDTLVVDVQTDLIGLDVTRIVAPLREKGLYASFPHLTPEVDFDGRRWIVRVQELASVTAGELGRTIGRIDGGRDDILRAVDILTRGF